MRKKKNPSTNRELIFFFFLMKFALQPKSQDKGHRTECLGIVPGKVEGPWRARVQINGSESCCSCTCWSPSLQVAWAAGPSFCGVQHVPKSKHINEWKEESL